MNPNKLVAFTSQELWESFHTTPLPLIQWRCWSESAFISLVRVSYHNGLLSQQLALELHVQTTSFVSVQLNGLGLGEQWPEVMELLWELRCF